MANIRACWNNNRQLALVLLLLALAVRALLPSGYMFGAGPKSITVYVCAQADGMANTITIPLDSDQPDPDHRSDDQGTCAFAGLASGADVSTLDVVDFVQAADTVAVMLPVAVAPGHGLAAPPPYATGPPTLI